MDASTLEFLGLFLAEFQHDRILALLTFRPEFKPAWVPLAAHLARGPMLELYLAGYSATDPAHDARTMLATFNALESAVARHQPWDPRYRLARQTNLSYLVNLYSSSK